MRSAFLILLFACLAAAVATVGQAATLASARPGNFFLPGETIEFTLTLAPDTRAEVAPLSVTVNLLGYAGQVLASVVLAEPVAAGARVQLEFPPQPEGFYRIEARVSAQVNGQAPLARSTLGVMAPATFVTPQAARRFGTIAHLKHMDAADREQMLALIARAGFGWIREGFLWHELEPFPGHWTTSGYDDLVERAFNHGLSVLPVLGFGNAWAAATDDTGLPTEQLRQSLPRLNLWENYVRTLVQRYGDRLRAWEVWNEPNLNSFWQPRPSAEDYAQLLARTHAVIKQVAPEATVLSAGLSPNQADHPRRPEVAEARFLRAIDALDPRPFDAVATHPYTLFQHGVTRARTTQLFQANLDNLLAGLDNGTEAGTGAVPLWITEVGVSTVARTATEEAAAAHLVNILTLAAARQDIARVFLYNFRDTGSDPVEKEQHFGLLHADYTPKPGYFAVRHFIRTLGAATFAGQRNTPEGVVVHEFAGAAGQPVLVAWAPGSQALDTVVELPPEVGSARISNVVGEARVVAVAEGALALTVSAEPLYIEALPTP